jgi:hypothetical protein
MLSYLSIFFCILTGDMVFIGATTILILSGVLSTKDAITNFANEGMLTVAVMYVLAKGIVSTGALSYFMTRY